MIKSRKFSFIIGLFSGILLTISAVYTASAYVANGSNVYYNNANSSLTSNTVQGALDELYNKLQTTSNLMYVDKGDWVEYTPSVASYVLSGTVSGTGSNQTLHPATNLANSGGKTYWRVLKINEGGTVDIISNYTTSEVPNFYGITGYCNFIGALVDIAGAYETSGITVGHRPYGYSNQVLTITDKSKITATTAPWTCDTTGYTGCNPVESQGGGDTGFLTDWNLVYNALGSRDAQNVSGNTSYAIASRYYYYGGSTLYQFSYRHSLPGSRDNQGAYSDLYRKRNQNFEELTRGEPIRIIVTLKAGLNWSGGDGTEAHPWVISS